jgi:hypothetical protein
LAGFVVRGVLPGHLRSALDGRDPVADREVRDLLRAGTVCRLRLEAGAGGVSSPPRPSSSGGPFLGGAGAGVWDPSQHVLVLKSEYDRAALLSLGKEEETAEAAVEEEEPSKAALRGQIAEWFVRESGVVDLVTEGEVESKLAELRHPRRQQQERRGPERARKRRDKPPASPPSSSSSSPPAARLPLLRRCPAAAVLSELQRLHLLRPYPPGPAGRSRGGRVYQLWLPGWGTAVTSFQRAAAQLLAALGRSRCKERPAAWLAQKTWGRPTATSGGSIVTGSSSSARRPWTAVPSEAVVEHLVSQGRVARVDRPSGAFVRLAT